MKILVARRSCRYRVAWLNNNGQTFYLKYIIPLKILIFRLSLTPTWKETRTHFLRHRGWQCRRGEGNSRILEARPSRLRSSESLSVPRNRRNSYVALTECELFMALPEKWNKQSLGKIKENANVSYTNNRNSFCSDYPISERNTHIQPWKMVFSFVIL